MNPPYGERMKPEDIESLYGMIGTTLKHRFPGSDAWILSSSGKALKRVGLKPNSKQNLLNGSLECSYVNYKTFKGNWKDYKTRENREDSTSLEIEPLLKKNKVLIDFIAVAVIF